MERVEVGAVFRIKTQEDLSLAKETVNLMVTLSRLERSTLFLFVAEDPELYLSAREVTEKFKMDNRFKSYVDFLTVYQEMSWTDTLKQWFRNSGIKYLYIWGKKIVPYNTIDNLLDSYLEHPTAGLIEGPKDDFITKPKHLYEEYSNTFKEDLERLGYKNYKLEIDEEEK